MLGSRARIWPGTTTAGGAGGEIFRDAATPAFAGADCALPAPRPRYPFLGGSLDTAPLPAFRRAPPAMRMPSGKAPTDSDRDATEQAPCPAGPAKLTPTHAGSISWAEKLGENRRVFASFCHIVVRGLLPSGAGGPQNQQRRALHRGSAMVNRSSTTDLDLLAERPGARVMPATYFKLRTTVGAVMAAGPREFLLGASGEGGAGGRFTRRSSPVFPDFAGPGPAFTGR